MVSLLLCRTRPVVITQVLFLLFFLFSVSDVQAQNGLRWVRPGGGIPAGSIVGGTDSNGNSLYICRTTHNGSTTVPGKVVAGKCNYNWGNTEYASGGYDILIGSGGYWTRELDPYTAIVALPDVVDTFYVCRAFASGGSHPGRLQNGKCNYGYGGKGYASTDFEVLNGSGGGGRSTAPVAAANLLDAATRADAVQVRAALRAGQGINQKNAKGQTALMLAAQKGAGEIVRLLLGEGAAVDARDNDGFTALGYAAFKGDAQSVRQLLRAGASLSSRTNNGNTPAYFAGASGDVETVRIIMSDPGYGEGEGLPLHGAAAYNQTGVIEYLVNNQDIDINQQDAHGQTAAVVAARNNKAGALSSLLRAGADLTVRTSNNSDIFGLASLANATDALNVLLGSGKYPIKSPLVEAGLRTAAKNSKLLALNLLLQRGVNPDGVQASVGNTAMMLAAIEGHDEIVQALLNARANIDATNVRGESALILAASGGKRSVVKMLVKAGADRDIADKNGKTALQYATQNNHGDTRKELEKGN